MRFFRYTHYLEEQIKELKQEKKELQLRNRELVSVLIPTLRKGVENLRSEVPKPEPEKIKHEIATKENRATCSCGWICSVDDPAKLQSEISAHYKENSAFIPVKGGRTSWPAVKQRLENSMTGETE